MSSSSSATPTEPATRWCKGCEQYLPVNMLVPKREKSKKGKIWYESKCSVCLPKDAKLRRDLKKQEKTRPKPLRCENCNIMTPHLMFDHCERTKRFRGWLCRSCNSGLGMLGDHPEGLIDSLDYYIITDPDETYELTPESLKKLKRITKILAARSKNRSRSPPVNKDDDDSSSDDSD